MVSWFLGINFITKLRSLEMAILYDFPCFPGYMKSNRSSLARTDTLEQTVGERTAEVVKEKDFQTIVPGRIGLRNQCLF